MRSSSARLVVKWSGTLLLGAFLFGQWNLHRAPGPLDRAILRVVAMSCPSAIEPHAGGPTVADGAHAIDRAGWRGIADAVLGGNRCGREPRRAQPDPVPVIVRHDPRRTHPRRHG